MERKKGCALTSEAPARDPRRRSSSLMRSLRISDLHRLKGMLAMFRAAPVFDNAYLLMFGAPDPSGKGTSSRRIFANVAFRFLPLNGVVP